MRKRIYNLIREDDVNNRESDIYDFIIMLTIILSTLPLAFKDSTPVLELFDLIGVLIFITDYCLRLVTADYKLKRGLKSFIIYPFTPMAILDLVSILPSITILNPGLKLLRTLRLIRALRVFRIFKFFRYSKSIPLITRVFKKEKETLSVVGILAFGYIIFSALVLFNVEPESFNSFFDAVYWATVSLTTVGYGDIYAKSNIGRIVTMVSSLFGIAVIALPSGILTAGFISELSKDKQESDLTNKN